MNTNIIYENGYYWVQFHADSEWEVARIQRKKVHCTDGEVYDLSEIHKLGAILRPPANT